MCCISVILVYTSIASSLAALALFCLMTVLFDFQPKMSISMAPQNHNSQPPKITVIDSSMLPDDGALDPRKITKQNKSS